LQVLPENLELFLFNYSKDKDYKIVYNL